MKKNRLVFFAGFLAVSSLLGTAMVFAAPKNKVVKLRVGHFSNITHAQALIAHATHKLEEVAGKEAIVEWKIFNAGPSAVEALFAGDIDIAVIGPSPAINAFVKSNGEAVRVIAGSASGGAALVTRKELNIQSVEDFHGKKIASPQLGNTQDVALRSWLKGSGLKLKQEGGDVQIIPLSNADQQTLFIKKEIDAAWTVEPWVSLLLEKADGKIYFEESELWANGKYSTALLLVRKKFLDEEPVLVKKFLAMHVELTQWIKQNPTEAQKIIRAEIQRESGKDLSEKILQSAFSRIEFTYEPLASSLIEQAKAAYQAGFLRKEPDLSSFFDLTLLEEVLGEKHLEVGWALEAGAQK